MKPAPVAAPPDLPPDLELAAACLGCGGDLSLRLRPGSSRSVCRTCGRWSSPFLTRVEDGLQVRQAAAGDA